MFESSTNISPHRRLANFANRLATTCLPNRNVSRCLYLLSATVCISLVFPNFVIGQTTNVPSSDSGVTAPQAKDQKQESPTQQQKNGKAQKPGQDSPQQQIETELRRIGKKYKQPSLFAGYQTLGKPFVGAALGRRKKGSQTRVTIDDKVHLGSCSKAMTATMIARLIERGPLEHGTLKWDTTIAEGLPELSKVIAPVFRDVTLRQLLMHRGGCPANTHWPAAGYKKSIVETRRSLVRIALKKEQENKPGDFLYSNVGYLVAGAMAERATGKSWEDLMRKEIFEPLGITSGGFGPPDVDQDLQQPWGHMSVATLQIPTHFDNPESLGPAGRVHISLEDWAKFCLSHVLTGNEVEGDKESQAAKAAAKLKLVSQSNLDLMHTPLEDVEGDGADYALGWDVLQREWGGTVFTHSGSNTLWTTIVWISPDNKSVYLTATNIANAQSGIGLDKIFATLIRLEKEARK